MRLKISLVNLRKLKSDQASFLTTTLWDWNQLQDKKWKKKKPTNMCRPDNILLDNQWITEEIEEKLKKFYRQIKTKEQRSKNQWKATKAILSVNFIAI